MITCTLYDSSGSKTGRVSLDLSKSQAGDRILAAIRDQRPGFSMKSLESLDSGRLSLSHIMALFGKDELQGAIERRLVELNAEDVELKDLQTLLGSGLFVAAQGGERARSRENRMISQWREMVGHPTKSMSAADIRKSTSRRAQSAIDILIAFGWYRGGGDQETARYTSTEVPGEILVEKSTQNWRHVRGARELAKSSGSPVCAAADLLAHLTRTHERNDKETNRLQ